LNLRTALFYAKKDVLKEKRISLFIIIAVAFGTTNVILVYGLVEGLKHDLTNNALKVSGDIIIYPAKGEKFIPSLRSKEKKLGLLSEVEAIAPRLEFVGVLSFKEISKPVQIIAIEPEKERRTTKIIEKIIEGEFLYDRDKNEIMITKRLSEDMKITIGDEVILIFENGARKKYKIKGILHLGVPELDASGVFINFEEAEEIMGIKDIASTILVKLKNRYISDEYKFVIMQQLSHSEIKSWEEEIGWILGAIRTMEELGNTVAFASLLAAVISVMVIIYINVVRRTRQIGIMKAIGASDSFVFTVFLLEAAIFGILGTITGDIAGYVACKYFETHPFYDPIYKDYIGTRFTIEVLYRASTVTLISALAAGIVPALKARRLEIVKTLWSG
jgi:lipoprotein-releasing system permease protein